MKMFAIVGENAAPMAVLLLCRKVVPAKLLVMFSCSR